MGDFSRTTFDKVNHYVGVRLQQGVPIVDADWNELEDIRKYELQAFLKWFVGDGVPAGNDGFRIAPLAGGGVGTIRLTSKATGPGLSSISVDFGASTAAAVLGFAPNNHATARSGSSPAQLTGDAIGPFTLTAGMTLVVSADGAPNETVTFTAAAAASAGDVVTAINAALTRVTASAGSGDDFAVMGGDGTPEGAGRCLVDGRDAVSEGRLSYRSQPLYNNSALAARWGVRVVEPLSAPSTGTRNDLVYLDVWEREVTAQEDDRLVNPLIGVESSVRLRREWAVRVRPGQDTVPVSIDADFTPGHSYLPLARLARQAGVPAIGPGTVTDLRSRSLLVPPSTLIDDVLGLTPDQYRRGENRPLTSLRTAINALLRGELPGTADIAIAPTTAQDSMSTAFTTVGNDVVAVWPSRRASTTPQLFVTRWPIGTPDAAATNLPIQVTSGATQHSLPASVVLPTGELVVVYESGQQDIHFRRGTVNGLSAATEIAVSASTTVNERQPFAVLSGDLVVFFWLQIVGSVRTLQYKRWRHTDNTFVDSAPQQLTATNSAAPSGGAGDLAAAVDGNGDIWVAFRADDGSSNTSIRLLRFRPSVAQVDEQTMSTGSPHDQPSVLVDGTDAVWVFWRSGTAPTTSVSYQRVPLPAPAPSSWPASPTPVAVSSATPGRPEAIRGSDGAVWLFCSQSVGAGSNRAIFLQRYLKNTGGWANARQITGSNAIDEQPVALVGPNGVVLLFWSSNRDSNPHVYTKQFITAI